MGRKLRHLLILLLIILKEPSMSGANWGCEPSRCDCSNRGLTSIPQNFPTSIYRLELSRNQITKIQPGAFSNLPRLLVLTLCFNQLTMIHPGAFLNLPQLQELDLSSNRITFIKPGTFRNLPRLQKLYLISNNIKIIQEAAVVTSGHDQTGQGQSQAITESNPNTTAAVEASDHGQFTGQGHPQAIIEFKNPLYGTGQMGSMQSPLYKVVGQSQAITEPNPNTTTSVEASDHGQPTGQDQSRAIIEVKNQSYGTGQMGSMQSPLYKVVGQYQAITQSNQNTTAAVITSGLDQQYEDMAPQHNQTGQGQSQAITESNTNTTAAVITSGLDQQYEDMAPQHNQTGQGQFQATTESNKSTTAAVMTSGLDQQYEDMAPQHNQTGQVQSQAITESNTNTPGAVMTSGHDHQYEDMNQHNQTGQVQPQAIAESSPNTTASVEAGDHGQSTEQGQSRPINDIRIPTYGTGQIVSMQSPLYKVVGQYHATTETKPNTTAAVVASGLDQQYEDMNQHNRTGQGQSQVITESNKNTTAAEMTSGLYHKYEDMNQ
uniref:LRRNT domain-containing protein n=1 Tax=Branchiostoma floridae TaxID=7739 RepID=C3ZDI2_BRAFL|eukprot:XP_002592777.1 hypothetical protein BRAFLDRAFT_65356 [Branchiostoma floridae]